MKKGCLILIVLWFLLVGIVAIAYFTLSRDVAPPETSDLMPERVEVADEDNAYIHFNAAVAVLDWPKGKDDELIGEILDGEKSDPKYVAELLEKNQEALKRIPKGLECRVCQGPAVHGICDDMEYLMDWRRLARLLKLESMQGRENQDYAQSAKACEQLVRMGGMIQNYPECFVNYLVGIAILGMGVEESRALAVEEGVSEAQLGQLAKALDAAAKMDQGLARALKGEYQVTANTIDDFHSGKMDAEDIGENVSVPKLGYLFQPNKTKTMIAEYFRNQLKEIKRPHAEQESLDSDVEEMVGMKGNRVKGMLAPNQIGRILIALLLPAVDAVSEAQCRTEAHLDATRLVVACRRYEMAHGRLPATLADLVPDYLDAVPTDPYDGQPFRYVRDKGIVYSVGKDMTDQGGSDVSPDGETFEDEMERLIQAEDAVFYIHGRAEGNEPTEINDPER